MGLNAHDLKGCSICGGVLEKDSLRGYFGILPVAFCDWCLDNIEEMIKGENNGKK